MEVCWVQRLLKELKQSGPLNVPSDIFRFDNYCIQLIIVDDNMQLLVPE